MREECYGKTCQKPAPHDEGLDPYDEGHQRAGIYRDTGYGCSVTGKVKRISVLHSKAVELDPKLMLCGGTHVELC